MTADNKTEKSAAGNIHPMRAIEKATRHTAILAVTPQDSAQAESDTSTCAGLDLQQHRRKTHLGLGAVGSNTHS